ncbi:SpoIID/LytB domain-containing protein [Ruminococcaceae bacterium OttesenSCG-928-A11]|nr:SpoIID/LytB domain-containing protein [Ruminococcaceae bacterium OttesenSCG-928-A11]
MKKRTVILTALSVLVCAGLVVGWIMLRDKTPEPEQTVLVGLQSVDGEHFYYDAAGAPQFGWHLIDGERYYFDPATGAAVHGWFTDSEGEIYYFCEAGYALTGAVTIDGKDYTFDEQGRLQGQAGATEEYTWQFEGGVVRCIGPDGEALTGLCEVGGALYYFDADGVRQTGWQTIDGGRYYFHPETGRATRGWSTIDGDTYYFDENGRAVTGAVSINGVAYTFNEKGVLTPNRAAFGGQGSSGTSQPAVLNPTPATPESGAVEAKGEWVGTKYRLPNGEWASGVVTIGGKLYGFDTKTKEMVTGRAAFNSLYYHFDTQTGAAQTGWLTDPADSGLWYYYSPAGPALTDMQVFSDGTRYYFDPSTGARQSGLIELSGKTYFFGGKNDSAVTGWAEVGGSELGTAGEGAEGGVTPRYYFCDEGYAVTGVQQLQDGSWYAFSAKGVQLYGWQDIGGKRYLMSGTGGSALLDQWADHADGKAYLGADGAALTSLQEIGGSKYYFDPAGIRQGGWVTVDGARYCFDGADNAALTGTWHESPTGTCYLGADGVAYTGAATVDGVLYGFASDGALLKGVKTIGGKLYFLDETTGAAQTGWQQDGAKIYYVGENGHAVDGVHAVDGKTYYFSPDTFIRMGGWVEAGGKLYLFDGEDQSARTGEYAIGGASYWFGSDGAALTGVQKLSGSYYYYNSKGVRQTGWQTDAGGYRYYFDPVTAAARIGWFTDIAQGGVYYFDSQGRALTGTQELDGITYKFDANGRLAPESAEGDGNWVTSGGKTYYVDAGGEYATGLRSIAGALYYFDKAGARQSGWAEVDGARYYFDGEDGDKAVAGWFTDEADGAIYHFGADGRAVTGVQKIDKDLYYFSHKTAVRTTGMVVENGARYYFDPANSGKARTGWHTLENEDEADETRYYDKSTGAALTGMQAIDGDLYLFDDAGVRQSGWHKDADGLIYRFSGTNDAAVIGKYTADEGTYYFTEGGYALVGLVRIEAGQAPSYFDANGLMQAGWQRLDGNRYYFGTGGPALTGEQKLDGESYYFHDTDGYALTGVHEMNGRTYVFDADSRMISKEATTGLAWVEKDGKLYYIDSAGEHPTGLEMVDGALYLFDADGAVKTGWQTVDGKRYHFGQNGKADLGWYRESGDSYYFGDDGAALTGKHTLPTGDYEFDADGKLASGNAPVFDSWEDNGDGTHSYYDTTGALATGLRAIAGKWYYFDSKGICQGGWQTVDGSHYHFGGENDSALTGWQTVDGRWYLFDAATAKQLVGWQYRPAGQGVTYTHYYDPATGKTPEGLGEVNGALRWFAEDGHMVTGWLDTEAGRYYFFQNGERASGVVTIEGALYSFGADGLMATGWNLARDGGRYYFTENGAASGWFTAEGRWYYASETTFRQQTGWQYRPAGEGVTHTFYYNADGSLPGAGFQTVLGVRRWFAEDGHMATGWQKIDGKLYYFTTKGEQATGQTSIVGVSYPFAADGSLTEGWYTAASGARQYFTEKGALLGWHQPEAGGVWYLFNEKTGVQQTGWQTRNAGGTAVKHYFSAAGEAATGWSTTAEGKRWFAADGAMATGWATLDGLKYYFDPASGLMATGAVYIDGELYTFGEDGQPAEGWFTDNSGKRFYIKDGTRLTGWQQLTEGSAQRWYHFDANGVQQLGWQARESSGKKLYYYYFTAGENHGGLSAAGWTTAIDGVNRYVLADGQMQQGAQTMDGKKLYFDEKGAPYTGWALIDGRWYCFDADGVRLTGWQTRTTDGGEAVDYFYNADGSLPGAGFQTVDGQRRYVTEDGGIAQGWVMIGEHKYYFKRGGQYVTGKLELDGETYYFDGEGRYVAPPSFAKVTWDKGKSTSKKIYVTVDVSPLLTDKTVEYRFSASGEWKKTTAGSTVEQSYSVKSGGQTIKAGAIQIRDSIGNVSTYGSDIVLEGTFSKSHGIDVSSHQGNINWAAVAASGKVEFAVIRGLTWSGDAATGKYVIDPKFNYNVRQAKAYGIKVGAYLYSYAFNGNEMVQEVNTFMNSAEVKALVNEGIYFDLPVFIDYEDDRIFKHTTQYNVSQRTEHLLAGLRQIEKAHGGKFKGGVYASLSWCSSMFNGKTIQDKGYSLWVAQWNKSISACSWTHKQADIWQYSNGETEKYGGYANIAGINTGVDQNWLYTDYSGSINGGKTPDPITADNYRLTVTNQNGQVVEGYAKDILAQIVMAEVGGMGDANVFKAQAIAAHTWLQYQYFDGYKAPSVALNTKPTDAVKTAVAEVAHLILDYNGQAALTPYYAASNGYTNDARYWNAANNLPYLRCVKSPYEGTYSSTKNTVTVTETVFKAKLKTIYGTDITAGYAAKDWIKITSRNEGNYVVGLNVCGRTPKVDYFITNIVSGIKSPSFSVSYADGTFTFTYQGNGHGIGMSQRGAQGYAKQGYDYKQILAHYFPGTALKALYEVA